MTRFAKGLIAVPGSIIITGILFMFLLAGTMKHKSQEDNVFMQGAIKLSQFKDKEVKKEEVYSAVDTPRVEKMDKVDPSMDTSLDQPEMEMEMPSVELDIASEMSGTIPMAGLNSLAAMSSMGVVSGGALTLGEVDEMPRVIYAPQPLYPRTEKARGVEKEVTVRIRLRRDGTVEEVTPIGQSPDTAAFHKAAIDAVMQWRFMPCRKGGKAVVCIADQPVGFSLN